MDRLASKFLVGDDCWEWHDFDNEKPMWLPPGNDCYPVRRAVAMFCAVSGCEFDSWPDSFGMGVVTKAP